MSDRPSPRSPQSVFDEIEAALGATAHGRAFLKECGRRARAEETSLLLDAVARLERRARMRSESLDRDELASLVSQVETALRDARLVVRRTIDPTAGDRSGPDVSGNAADGTMEDAIELVQETAWRMREAGIDPSLCDLLDEQTSAIHSASRRRERMFDGLGTIERAITRADSFVGELKRALAPMPAPSPVPLVNNAPVTLLDSDIEFVVTADPPEAAQE